MRKILLGTTAVVGAALFGAAPVQAQTAPTVRLGGFMVGMYNWVNDDADKAQGAPTGVAGAGRVARSRNDFRNEVEVQVFVSGKAANGLAYGAVIEMQNDNSGASGAGSVIDLDEAYAFVSSPTLGSFRFGEEDSAASLLQVRMPTIAGLGPDGDFDDNILIDRSSTSATGPSLLTGINDGNDATKIVYLSPQFFGIDAGVSYAPNAGEGERAWRGRSFDNANIAGGAAFPTSNLQRDRTTIQNEVSGAIRYRGTFGGVGVAAGFGAMTAEGTGATSAGAPSSARNTSAYTAGLSLTAYGFSVGGEYSWGNYSGVSVGRASLANNADGSKRDSSNHYVLGASYVTGALSFGAFYGVGTQDNGPGISDREQTIYGVGVAYTVAPGLDIFANYNVIQDQNLVASGFPAPQTTRVVSRDADVILVGTRLAF